MMHLILDLLTLFLVIWLAVVVVLYACGIVAGLTVDGVNALWRLAFGPPHCARHARRKTRWS